MATHMLYDWHSESVPLAEGQYEATLLEPIGLFFGKMAS
jgi:hypothetical protein